jgi:hypothetical protein
VPARSHPSISKHTGRLRALAITLVGLFVLASAGVPTLAVVEASDPVASIAPGMSPSPSPTASAAPSPSATVAASPGPSAEPSATASPEPSVVPSPTPAPSPTPPPGAIAAVRLTSQPYELPVFVGLGAWQASTVSFYGPGFYCISDKVSACLPQVGSFSWPRLTACGVLYTRTVVGVANRTLPCGTLVAFSYGGRTVVAPVIDRGPYVAGRLWDLSGGLCTALRHCFTGPIKWSIVHRAIGPTAPVRIELRRL